MLLLQEPGQRQVIEAELERYGVSPRRQPEYCLVHDLPRLLREAPRPLVFHGDPLIQGVKAGLRLLFSFLCGKPATHLYPEQIASLRHSRWICAKRLDGDAARSDVEESWLDGLRSLLGPARDADALLRGVIVEYLKGALTFDRAQTVDEFKVEIVVAVEFEDLREGKVLWKEPEFRAWESYSDTGDGPGEEDAVEAAITTLAVDMLSRAMEGW